MRNVPDAWWIGRGPSEASPYEIELQNELDTQRLELRKADRMLCLVDDDDHIKIAMLELLITETEERINTILRELRYLRYYA
jgi:hypothetical protein